MRKLKIKPTCYQTSLLALILAPTLAYSVEIDISAGGAMEYSANALRTDNNQGSETEQSAIVRFGLTEAGDELIANMNYSAEKRRYVQKKFDDETVLEGTTALEWRALPHRLSLLADHHISDTVSDNRVPNTPDNRDKQQVVGVGARFQARPSPVDNLFLLLRGASVHFDEQSGSDNKRKQATLSWQHLISQTSSINAGTSISDIEYDEDSATDYQYQSYFIGAATQFLRGDLSLRIGVNKIEREDLDDMDGNTYRLAWTENSGLDPFQWSIYYAEDLTDSSIGLIGDDFLPPDTDSGSNFEEIDILETQQLGANFSYRLTQIRSQLGLDLLWQDDDYEEQPNDEELRSIELSLTHDFTHQLNGRFYLQLDERDFLNDDTAYDEKTAGFRCDYRINRQLDLSFDIYHIKRDHTVTISDYEDSVARLEMMYTFR